MLGEGYTMQTFVILARGKSVVQSQVVAQSAHPLLVAYVARHLLKEPAPWGHAAPSTDPVLRPLRSGRRRALEIALRNAEQQASPEEPRA